MGIGIGEMATGDWLVGRLAGWPLRLAGPVAARPGRDKMYANGLINYEISSARLREAIKASTAKAQPGGR